MTRHQANHARIEALRAEAEALQEQLKSSVATLASLRHELFDTASTTFPTDSRPVRVDEVLRYAKNISKYTVPPTYREKAPATPEDKDKDKDDATSAAPTNGLNTPAHAPDAMDITKALPEPQKEGESADTAPVEITAEEEEWLKKLKDSRIAWYPWPSDDKVRSGNLYKIMYWEAKQKDIDTFNIHAHEEVERLKEQGVEVPEEPVPEAAAQEAPVVQQQPAAPRPPRPQQATFDAFDELD